MALITLQNVSYSYGPLAVLDKVTIAVNSGEVLAISGKSGIGKSTLLQLIAKRLLAEKGTVEVGAETTLQSQTLSLFPKLTAVENCILPSLFQGRQKKKVTGEAIEYLEQLQLSDIIHKPCSNISRGQQQRVSLVRALCVNKPILLLDEPATAIDEESRGLMLSLLDGWLSKDPLRLIVLVSHNPAVLQWAHREVQIEAGQILPIRG